jgi:hypothetical protein
MQKRMYLLVSQHISGIIMPIIVKPFPTSAHQPPLLHESSAARPVLYTIGAVDFGIAHVNN